MDSGRVQDGEYCPVVAGTGKHPAQRPDQLMFKLAGTVVFAIDPELGQRLQWIGPQIQQSIGLDNDAEEHRPAESGDRHVPARMFGVGRPPAGVTDPRHSSIGAVESYGHGVQGYRPYCDVAGLSAAGQLDEPDRVVRQGGGTARLMISCA